MGSAAAERPVNPVHHACPWCGEREAVLVRAHNGTFTYGPAFVRCTVDACGKRGPSFCPTQHGVLGANRRAQKAWADLGPSLWMGPSTWPAQRLAAAQDEAAARRGGRA